MREQVSQKVSQNDLISIFPGATWPVLREFEQDTEYLSQKIIWNTLMNYASYRNISVMLQKYIGDEAKIQLEWNPRSSTCSSKEL